MKTLPPHKLQILLNNERPCNGERICFAYTHAVDRRRALPCLLSYYLTRSKLRSVSSGRACSGDGIGAAETSVGGRQAVMLVQEMNGCKKKALQLRAAEGHESPICPRCYTHLHSQDSSARSMSLSFFRAPRQRAGFWGLTQKNP